MEVGRRISLGRRHPLVRAKLYHHHPSTIDLGPFQRAMPLHYRHLAL